jgi:hypothetical protein
VVVLVRLQGTRSQAEQDAATAATRSVGPGLAIAASGETPADVPSFRELAVSLISPSMPALRLWAPEGDLLASVGDDQSEQADGAAIARALSGTGVSHREDIAGQDRLTSYIALDADSVLRSSRTTRRSRRRSSRCATT